MSADELRNKLEAWRAQILAYDPSQDFSPGILYGWGIKAARKEILDKLDELLGKEDKGASASGSDDSAGKGV